VLTVGPRESVFGEPSNLQRRAFDALHARSAGAGGTRPPRSLSPPHMPNLSPSQEHPRALTANLESCADRCDAIDGPLAHDGGREGDRGLGGSFGERPLSPHFSALLRMSGSGSSSPPVLRGRGGAGEEDKSALYALTVAVATYVGHLALIPALTMNKPMSPGCYGDVLPYGASTFLVRCRSEGERLACVRTDRG
jgi:hypothetical protein